MGYYIPGPPQGKVEYLTRVYKDATVIPVPDSFNVPDDKALVCVVENPHFDAAGYCYNEREFKEFTDTSDPRHKTWVLMDKDDAELESGFRER